MAKRNYSKRNSKIYPGRGGNMGNQLTEGKPAGKGHMKAVPTNSRYISGDFAVYKPQKYVGTYPIVYRSSYEFQFMRKLELNPTVESWNSENIKIPYKMPTNKGVVSKTYYMDFEVISKSGKRYIIEVKPESKTPTTLAEINRNPENLMNACKWKYALLWAKARNYIFRIIGETQLKKHINFN